MLYQKHVYVVSNQESTKSKLRLGVSLVKLAGRNSEVLLILSDGEVVKPFIVRPPLGPRGSLTAGANCGLRNHFWKRHPEGIDLPVNGITNSKS